MRKLIFSKLFFLLILTVSLNVSAQESIEDAIQKYNSGSISYISVEELKAKLFDGENLLLLDTRSKEEYEVSHLKNAIWIGYKKFDKDKVKNIDKDSKIIVYCSVGVRSEKIGEKLKALEFDNIQNLYGGIFEWINSGYPIYKNEKLTTKIHTFNKRWEQYIKQGEKVN